MPWRVQATFVVDDKVRAFSPVVEHDEPTAQRVAAGMRETLRHLPALRVLVTEVDDAEAARLLQFDETAATSGSDRAVDGAVDGAADGASHGTHVLDDALSATTRCGVDAVAVDAWVTQDLLDISPEARDRLCPRCDSA